MILLTILLSTYILAVNFYGFRLLKTQRDGFEAGEKKAGEGDGKLLLAAALGGRSPSTPRCSCSNTAWKAAC